MAWAESAPDSSSRMRDLAAVVDREQRLTRSSRACCIDCGCGQVAAGPVGGAVPFLHRAGLLTGLTE